MQQEEVKNSRLGLFFLTLQTRATAAGLDGLGEQTANAAPAVTTSCWGLHAV